MNPINIPLSSWAVDIKVKDKSLFVKNGLRSTHGIGDHFFSDHPTQITHNFPVCKNLKSMIDYATALGASAAAARTGATRTASAGAASYTTDGHSPIARSRDSNGTLSRSFIVSQL